MNTLSETKNNLHNSINDRVMFKDCLRNILKNLDISIVKQYNSLNQTSRLISMKKFLEENLVYEVVEN